MPCVFMDSWIFYCNQVINFVEAYQKYCLTTYGSFEGTTTLQGELHWSLTNHDNNDDHRQYDYCSAFAFIQNRNILPDDFQKLLSLGLYVVVPDLSVDEVAKYLGCTTAVLPKAICVRPHSGNRWWFHHNSWLGLGILLHQEVLVSEPSTEYSLKIEEPCHRDVRELGILCIDAVDQCPYECLVHCQMRKWNCHGTLGKRLLQYSDHFPDHEFLHCLHPHSFNQVIWISIFILSFRSVTWVRSRWCGWWCWRCWCVLTGLFNTSQWSKPFHDWTSPSMEHWTVQEPIRTPPSIRWARRGAYLASSWNFCFAMMHDSAQSTPKSQSSIDVGFSNCFGECFKSKLSNKNWKLI